ncbi:MAG: hypothetical protein ACR2F2_04285 [Pyrinomonadaceae bacterium]
MKKVPIQKFQIIFRTAVLCALLTGLLFSCGEGIRLFPFPEAETTENEFSQLNFENKISYQFNIHRLEERQGNHKTKSQRNSQNHYFIESGAISDSIFRISNDRKKFNFPTAAEDLKSPLFSESGESRAPPLCI